MGNWIDPKMLDMEFLLFWSLLVHAAESAVLKNGVTVPTYAKVCKRRDPEMDLCLRNSIESTLHQIAAGGIKELKMPPVDPMKFGGFQRKFQGPGFNLDFSVSQPEVRGFGRANITRVRTNFSDPENMAIDVDYYAPIFRATGNYRAKGVAVINIDGGGPFSINISALSARVKLAGQLEARDGSQYLRVDQVAILPRAEHNVFYFENIFPDNRLLSEAANMFANSHWRYFWETVMPHVIHHRLLMKHYVNLITMSIPFGQLIPE